MTKNSQMLNLFQKIQLLLRILKFNTLIPILKYLHSKNFSISKTLTSKRHFITNTNHTEIEMLTEAPTRRKQYHVVGHRPSTPEIGPLR